MARGRRSAEPVAENAGQQNDAPVGDATNTPPGGPEKDPDASALPAPDPEDMKKVKPNLPESVTLAAPHGYIDDDDVNHHWHPGQVVTDEDEIALLIGRKAPLVGITYDD